MKAKKFWILALLVTCCIAFLSLTLLGVSWSEKHQLEEFGISTLHGFKGVHPVVNSIFLLGEEEEKQFTLLTQSELQTQVELALRKAGIKVAESSKNEPDIALLGVFIEVMRDSISEEAVRSFSPSAMEVQIYVFKVSTENYQYVRLTRDPKIFTRARCWPSYSFAAGRGLTFAGSSAVAGAIKKEVARQVDEFINDYLAANPKPPKDD